MGCASDPLDRVLQQRNEVGSRTWRSQRRKGAACDLPYGRVFVVEDMVDVGEETGALDTMMYKVADVYDEEVAVAVDGLISMLEPIMVVVLGLIVGFIVIALFMPLVKLLNELS